MVLGDSLIDGERFHCYCFSMMMTLDIPQDIFESARLSADEMKVEIAVSLYGAGRLSIGKARELAGMSLWQFRQLLASRGISPHLDSDNLDQELAALREMDMV